MSELLHRSWDATQLDSNNAGDVGDVRALSVEEYSSLAMDYGEMLMAGQEATEYLQARWNCRCYDRTATQARRPAVRR